MYSVLRLIMLVVTLFFSVSHSLNADIVDKITASNYFATIRPNKSQRYIGTIRVRNNKMRIDYESDAGYHPTIMAYNISAEKIEIIIKYRWLGRNSEIAFRADEKSPSYYYLVEFTENDGGIFYDCTFIDKVSLDNFTINNGLVNDNNVNIREEPSLNGRRTGQLNKNGETTVIGIGEEYIEVNNLMDYWYKIEIKNRQSWIFGYYIDFMDEIKLEKNLPKSHTNEFHNADN